MIQVEIEPRNIKYPTQTTIKITVTNRSDSFALLNFQLKSSSPVTEKTIDSKCHNQLPDRVSLESQRTTEIELIFDKSLSEICNKEDTVFNLQLVVTNLKTYIQQTVDFTLTVEQTNQMIQNNIIEQQATNFQTFNCSFTVAQVDNNGRITGRIQKDNQSFIEFLSDDTYLTMLAIPEGRFKMGADSNEHKRQNAEFPNRDVNIHSFYMSQTPVTQKQWVAIMNSNPSKFTDNQLNEELPVESISWQDATEFCQKLSELKNRTYRLPSEAEWEYAARGGVGQNLPFHFGQMITTALANYNGSLESYRYVKTTEEYRGRTTPVTGFRLGNNFGLLDIHGNVWEWCLDSWHDNYQNAPDDGRPWQMGGRQDLKIVRGGSWKSPADECRLAFRGALDMDLPLPYVGFRVVCVI